MKRQPQHKTTGQSLWHVPLSARSFTRRRAGGADGTCRDHWWSPLEKMHFSHVILALGAVLIFSVSFNGREKKLELCVSPLCQGLKKMKNFSDSPALCRETTLVVGHVAGLRRVKEL